MAKTKSKKIIELAQAGQTVESAPTVAQLDAPVAPPVSAEQPEPVNPFAYSDIKDIVRVPAGFQCAVKFDARDDYLLFVASPDDVELHGRAIYADCLSGRRGDTPHYFPTDAELLAAVQERASRELRRANSEVTKYQDRVDIDDASDVDIAMLRAWKTYRVGLNRLPDQPGYPHRLTWPVAPDASVI